jgi:hypothetical protein
MDKFLTPTVPRSLGSLCPAPGYLVYGYADFSKSGQFGFQGALDPTFAGVPVTAASPLECNSKATAYALAYNKFAKMKYDYSLANAKYSADLDAFKRGGMKGVQPAKPVDPIPLAYPPSAVLFFNQIETQTVRCTSDGKCGPSIGERTAIVNEDKWVYTTRKPTDPSIPSVQSVVWSFIADAAAAPFGRQCQIHFRPCESVRELLFSDGRNASVTGVGNSDSGAQTLATVPYIRDGCAPSRTGLTLAKECTVLAEDHNRLGPTDGWKWYLDGLPDTGSLSKTSSVENVCGLFPSLQECDCLARQERPNFNQFKTNFTSTSEICWYLPCSLEGSDRLVTPQQAKARDECSPNVCQSITNVVNSDKVDLKDVQNTINCSTEEYEAGVKKAAEAEAGGGLVAGVTGTINNITSGLDTGTIVAIVCIVLVVILLIAATRLYFVSSSAQVPPADAAPAAPAAPAVVATVK